MVKAYREQYLLLISEIKKKTSIGICGEKTIAVHISPSSRPAATCLDFSHLVMSTLLAGCSGHVPDAWRLAKAAGLVARGSPVLMWTCLLFT